MEVWHLEGLNPIGRANVAECDLQSQSVEGYRHLMEGS